VVVDTAGTNDVVVDTAGTNDVVVNVGAGTNDVVVNVGAGTSTSGSASGTKVAVRSSTRMLAPSGKTCRSTNSTAVFAT